MRQKIRNWFGWSEDWTRPYPRLYEGKRQERYRDGHWFSSVLKFTARNIFFSSFIAYQYFNFFSVYWKKSGLASRFQKYSLSLATLAVANIYAYVFLEDDRPEVLLEDCGSRYGTFINKPTPKDKQLSKEDVTRLKRFVCLCSFILIFVLV